MRYRKDDHKIKMLSAYGPHWRKRLYFKHSQWFLKQMIRMHHILYK